MTVALVITATSLATAQVSPDSLTPSAGAAAGTPVLKPALATPGQATTATGTGTGTGKLPTRIKRPVVLQLKTTGSWTKSAKASTSGRGTYRFTTTAPSSAGALSWRVKAPTVVVRSATGTKTYKAFTSPTATTKVAYPSTPTPTPTPTPTSTPTPTPAPTPDTTPPAVPGGLTASGGDSTVTLTWAPVTATDLAGYTVYQATTPDGPWTVVTGSNSVSATTWTATGLANDTAH